MTANGVSEWGRKEEEKQIPLDNFYQKPNEPYFMNVMVFYDLLCNSLKHLDPQPALSLFLSLMSVAIFAITNATL